MSGYLIGVDQGTTNTKAVLVDEHGKILGLATRPIPVETPEPGWAEQDPMVMFANVTACIAELLDRQDVSAGQVAALGISNQTETLVLWEAETGRPVHPAIIWQCRRSQAEAAELEAPETVALIRRRSGLDLDPTFTATKLRWVLNHRPEIAEGLRAGRVLFGTVDSWLVWKLTGGACYATESSNASRTMLFRIDDLEWDDELFDLFELPIGRRPEVHRTTGPFGHTAGALFGAEIPITGVLGDQQAALFGHGCHAQGGLKVTYGTGAFIWANAGHDYSPREGAGFLQTVAWHLDRPTYAFEGFIMYAGAILDWLASTLGLGADALEIVRKAREAGDSQGVALVPAFQGLASPWWNAEVSAAFLGLNASTRDGHLCHAALEAVCFQVRRVLEAMREDGGTEARALRVDGGPTKSDYLMQLQADVLDQPLWRAAEENVTPLGAALMAGLGRGLWSDPAEIAPLLGPGEEVRPSGESGRRTEAQYHRWLAAVDAAIAWSERTTSGR